MSHEQWAREPGIWFWGQVPSSCLLFCLHWVCVFTGDSGLVPEQKGQVEENRERGLRPGARSQGAHGRGDSTTCEKYQLPTPWGPDTKQEGGPGGSAEVRWAGPWGLMGRGAQGWELSAIFFLCQPGATCGSHSTFLPILLARDPSEYGHICPGPVTRCLPER